MKLFVVPLAAFALMLCLPLAIAQSTASDSPINESPIFEQQDLFRAEQGGYAVYRIPGLIVTPRGSLLAYCEARRDSGSDWGAIDLVLRRSDDGGRTWSPQRVVGQLAGPIEPNPLSPARKLSTADNATTYNNLVAIADGVSDEIHVVYCVEYMRVFVMHSRDDGQSFSEPQEITASLESLQDVYPWKVVAAGPGHGIQIRSGPHRGRLVVPVWLSTGTGGHAHRPSVVTTIISDDHGRSWQVGEIALPNEPPLINPNESAVVELDDGRIMLNSRTESHAHRRVSTQSADGATNWSPPRFEEPLFEPICMAGLVRLPAEQNAQESGVRLLFSGPDSLRPRPGRDAVPGVGRRRENLTLRLSEDGGETWPIARVLEEGPSAYSDVAAGSDGTIYCLYECGDPNDREYRSLRLASFNEAWLRQGQRRPLGENAAASEAAAD